MWRKASGGSFTPMPLPLTVRRCQPLLGTFVTLTVQDARPAGELDAILATAFAAIAKVASLMSFHDPASEVTCLNQTAHKTAVPVHDWTWQVLTAALEIARGSKGAFDPTIAPLLERWGFLPTLQERPDRAASYLDIVLLEDRSVRFLRPLHLDLGGIAKGFAIDQAIAVFEAHGITSAIVDAGGDLRLHGTASQNPPPLQVRHPRDPMRSFLTIPMTGPAAASSAGYFSSRRYRFRRVTPLVNPLTSRPSILPESITVCAPTALLADALTKVVLFRPTAEPPALLAKYGAQATLIDSHGNIHPMASVS